MNRILVGLTAALLGAACSDPFPPQNLTVRISLTGDQCGVTSASATVSGGGMGYIGPVTLSVGSGEIYGTITGVPAGPDRIVTVTAYNTYGYRVYSGSTTVTVIADATVNANIVLQRDPYNCTATGTISVTGSISNGPLTDGGVSDAGEVLATVSYQYTDVELTADGVLHFFDPVADRLHRYDLVAGTAPADLVGSLDAVAMAVSPDGQFAYMTYTGGRIDAFDLDAGTSKFLASGPATLVDVVVAGELLWASEADSSYSAHALFSRTSGTRTSSADWRYPVRQPLYSPANRRVYYLDEGYYTPSIHMESVDGGVLGSEYASPYGDYNIQPPLRLLRDESGVVTGSGLIFNTSDLSYRTSLGLSFTDIAFVDSRLYLIDSVEAYTQLRVLAADYSIVDTSYFTGVPVRIFPWQGKLLLLTRSSSTTTVRRLTP